MKEIKLTQGQVTIVCDCHAHLLEGYKWQAAYSTRTHSFYAVRKARVPEMLCGAPRTISMHTVVNGTPRGFLTDHKNHNTLDNRCENLRTATHSQNNRNRNKRTPQNSTCSYKGVSWNKRDRKYQVHITIKNKKRHVGYFDSEEDAARAYDEAARKQYGEFASLNFEKEQNG